MLLFVGFFVLVIVMIVVAATSRFMSVESRLGLDADMGPVTADAWASWSGQLPQLAVVEDPRDLRAWLKDADDQWADDVQMGRGL